MMLKRMGLALVIMFAFPLMRVGAQQPTARSDLLIRIRGPVTINPSESIGMLWVINNDVNVLGSVEELVVINGTARVSGTVRGNAVLLRSTMTLAPTAHVGKDVLLYRSTMHGVAGTVAGKVHYESGASFGPGALWMLWVSITLAFMVAGLAFGYLFGDSLASVADQVRTDWRGIFLVTIALVCGLPIAAVLSFMTGVGFVLGLFIMFAVIPALSVLGYLVAGTSLGRGILQVPRGSREKLFGSIVLGMVALQMMALVPGIGVLAAFLGSWFGAAALVHRAWNHQRHRSGAASIITSAA
jgi:hypothetical protein